MRKIFVCALFLSLVFAASSHAEVVGTLTKLNAAPEKFSGDNPYTGSDKALIAALFAEGINQNNMSFRYFDSLTLMQMALNRGDIDSIILPAVVGDYLLRNNSEYNLHGFTITRKPVMLAFGFLESNAGLRDKFNQALDDMSHGEIELLLRDYMTTNNPPAVEFAHFDDADTINIAVTGDMPPLDYIAADGKPAGFNTALLAAIGKRLRVNINPVITETGARVAALKSGRADIVFWIALFSDGLKLDLPDGVIVSKPYYGWDKVYFAGRRRDR